MKIINSFVKELISTLGDSRLLVEKMSLYMTKNEHIEGDHQSVEYALNQKILSLLKIKKSLTHNNCIGLALFFNKASPMQSITAFNAIQKIEKQMDDAKFIDNIIGILSDCPENIGLSRLMFIRSCNYWKVLMTETLQDVFSADSKLVQKTSHELLLQ